MEPECNCSCDIDSCDMPKVVRAKIRTARKSHVCEECGGVIPKGKRYEYVRGLWDSDWSTHRTCLACVRIRTRYCPTCFAHGGVAHMIEECLGFDYRCIPEDDDAEGD